jgi:5-amino-6-(5-phospho-D-ribitylamino)uracil phosphatase
VGQSRNGQRLVSPFDLIALDLDGTLLAPDDTVSPRNRAAIDRALAAGIHVVFVTGRGADVPLHIARDLGLSLPYICAHGALTKDVASGRTLAHVPVPFAEAREIVAFAEAHDLPLAVYLEDGFYRNALTPPYLADMTGPGWTIVPSLLDRLIAAPTFLRVFGHAAVDQMVAHFGARPLNFRYESWGDLLECVVLNRHAGKREALAQLCSDLGIAADRVLAVGDSRNDVPMLHWAGVGVAMGNALPEVRAAVVHVTESNDRDGVAVAIERFCFAMEKKGA